MKRILTSGCFLLFSHANFAGAAGRKGVSDDQLLGFTAGLIGLLLLIGFSKDIIRFLRQKWHSRFHHR